MNQTTFQKTIENLYQKHGDPTTFRERVGALIEVWEDLPFGGDAAHARNGAAPSSNGTSHSAKGGASKKAASKKATTKKAATKKGGTKKAAAPNGGATKKGGTKGAKKAGRPRGRRTVYTDTQRETLDAEVLRFIRETEYNGTKGASTLSTLNQNVYAEVQKPDSKLAFLSHLGEKGLFNHVRTSVERLHAGGKLTETRESDTRGRHKVFYFKG